jgi:hypothetical protein
MIRIRKREILKRKTITIHYPGNNAFHFPPVLSALNHSHFLKHHSRLHSYFPIHRSQCQSETGGDELCSHGGGGTCTL